MVEYTHISADLQLEKCAQIVDNPYMYSFLHQTIAFALRTSGKTHDLNPNSGENGHLKKVEMSSGFER